MATPLLTIHCITYNHVDFIAQTLDSFLAQKTNFTFQVVVGDDCSTDGTTEIIKEYAKRYPDIIKPIFREKNVGCERNFFDVSNACKTKYVAMCEGDDYWIDENKLQKQVDFLESNPDFSLCFHKVKVVWEDKSNKDSFFPKPRQRHNKDVLGLDELLSGNFIQTNSVVYRWRFIEESVEKIFPKKILPIDYYLHLLHTQKGKIKYLDDCMAVYRRHSGGIWFGCGQSEDWFLRNGLLHARFFYEVQKNFAKDFSAEIYYMLTTTLSLCFKHRKFDNFETYLEGSPIDSIRILPPDSSSTVNQFERKFKKYKKRFKRLLIITILLSIGFIGSLSYLIFK